MPYRTSRPASSIEQLLKKGITDMEIMAAAKPQSIVRKFQLLLFPESAYPAFQKIFLGRWIVFVTAIFFVFCSYKFGIRRNDSQQKIKMEQVENDKIRKAWMELYKQENQKGKQRMNTVYGNLK